MRVTVHYLAQLKQAAGRGSEETTALPGAALGDFLRALGERRPGAFRAMLLDETGQPRSTLVYFVGEEHAPLTHPLQDGDSVTILAPMSGGET